MMEFTYAKLKNAADNGIRVGHWKGILVYSASKLELTKLNSDYCYILYDDDNSLYYNGNIIGQVLLNGDVVEYVRKEIFPRMPTKEEKRQYQEEGEETYDLNEMLDRICDEVSKMLDEACLE